MHASHRRLLIAVLPSVLIACPATAFPLISEVFYDAVGSDNGVTFVELYGAPGNSLEGLFLEGVNGANGVVGPIVTLSGVFPGDGIFVVADDAGDGTTAIAGADLIANFDFQNGPDSIVLTNGVVALDAVGYGVFDPGEFFAGEGASADDPSAGSSLARLFANVDTDDNATDFAPLATPTPGVVTLLGVPQPETGALLGSGLLLLAWTGRRRRK